MSGSRLKAIRNFRRIGKAGDCSHVMVGHRLFLADRRSCVSSKTYLSCPSKSPSKSRVAQIFLYLVPLHSP